MKSWRGFYWYAFNEAPSLPFLYAQKILGAGSTVAYGQTILLAGNNLLF